jgi:predicted DNA-binding transcriptional regulator AlpA
MENLNEGLTLESLPRAFSHLSSEVSEIKRLLIEQSAEHSTKNDRWMDINELCQYHPDKPTKATVYGWVNARAIPVHKGGKKLRFLVSEIDEWLLSNRLQSQAEMVNEAGKYLVNKNGGKR